MPASRWLSRAPLILLTVWLLFAACLPVQAPQPAVTKPTASPGRPLARPEQATLASAEPSEHPAALLDTSEPRPHPTQSPTATEPPGLNFRTPLEAGTPYPSAGGRRIINILLIGTDQRGSPTYRTDALILVSIQPAYRLVTLLSIPRDLYVEIPGWKANRINAAYQHGESGGHRDGGAGLLKETLRKNLGIEVDHHALLDFDGFRQAIDAIGGIEVPVPCPFTDWRIIDPSGDPEDADNWELFTVGPGEVPMDGDLALWYARSRLRSSDYDRARRQQAILRAAYQKGVEANLLPRLGDLYRQLRDSVKSDLELSDLLQLSPLTFEITATRVRSYYIQGPYVIPWQTPSGGNVLLPNGETLPGLLREVFSPPDEVEVDHMATSIEIWNWTDHADWDALAADRLYYAGFQVESGPAVPGAAERTLLYDLTLAQDGHRSAALLDLLGLPGSSLRAELGPTAATDFRLILGADYDPCFHANRIQR